MSNKRNTQTELDGSAWGCLINACLIALFLGVVIGLAAGVPW